VGKLQKFWKGLIAGGAAGVALAAVNAAVARDVPEPETGALGGEAGTYAWKHGQIFYRHAGEETAPPLLFVHGIGAGARSFMWRRSEEHTSELQSRQYLVCRLLLEKKKKKNKRKK